MNDARHDPPGEHWKNPYLDGQGREFCGHCGDNWPCEAVREGKTVTGEELYNRLHDAYVNGAIGTTTVPWDAISEVERPEWDRIAREEGS